MKFGITILLICLGLLYIPTCQAECTKYILTSCSQKLELAKARGFPSISHVCRILNNYIDCVKSCGEEQELREAAYAAMAQYGGVKCGSAMATLSGALGILTVLATLKNYFESQLSF